MTTRMAAYNEIFLDAYRRYDAFANLAQDRQSESGQYGCTVVERGRQRSTASVDRVMLISGAGILTFTSVMTVTLPSGSVIIDTNGIPYFVPSDGSVLITSDGSRVMGDVVPFPTMETPHGPPTYDQIIDAALVAMRKIV